MFKIRHALTTKIIKPSPHISKLGLVMRRNLDPHQAPKQLTINKRKS
ncbi:hypothetical protein EJK50_1516 [Moraxella catarrhalis]|nr:hypothetical protein EJK50_1516 [Moraxella catarrhalis]